MNLNFSIYKEKKLNREMEVFANYVSTVDSKSLGTEVNFFFFFWTKCVQKSPRAPREKKKVSIWIKQNK